MRTLKTIGLVIAMYLVALIVELIMVSGSPDYEGGLSALVVIGILAIAAPKVGYRWFDCFFAIIPFYGIFFIFKIAHRAAFLPKVDWELRTN